MLADPTLASPAVRAAARDLFAEGNPAGQRLIRYLAVVCYAGRTTHVPGDPYESAFREGMRAAFQHLCALAAEDEKEGGPWAS